MKKSTRVWLVLAICFTVYMIYLAGSAATYDHQDFSAVEAIPFGIMSRYQFQRRLDWVLGFALISWVIWGRQFVGEVASRTEEDGREGS